MQTTIETPVCTKVAARYLGLSHRTLEQWRCNGAGPAFIQAGRRVLYLVRDLDAFISKNRHDPEALMRATFT